MKKIEAIIRPFKLDDIKEALAALGRSSTVFPVF
jgi:nitrogen regulatory protein PII